MRDEFINTVFESEILHGWWKSELFEGPEGVMMRLWEYRSANTNDVIIQFRDERDLAITDTIVVPTKFLPFVIRKFLAIAPNTELTTPVRECVFEELPGLDTETNLFEEQPAPQIILSEIGRDLLKEFGLESATDIIKYQTLYCIATKFNHAMKNKYSVHKILGILTNDLQLEYLLLPESTTVPSLQLHLAIEEFFRTKIGDSLYTRNWLQELEILLWKCEYDSQRNTNEIKPLVLTPLGAKIINSLAQSNITDVLRCRIVLTITQLVAIQRDTDWGYIEIRDVLAECIPDIYMKMPGSTRIVDEPLFTTIKNLLANEDLKNDLKYAILEKRKTNEKSIGASDILQVNNKKLPSYEYIGETRNNSSFKLNDLGIRITSDLNLKNTPEYLKIGVILMLAGEIRKLTGFRYAIAQITLTLVDAFPGNYKVPYDIDSEFIDDYVDKLQHYNKDFDYDLIKRVSDKWQHAVLDALQNRRS